MPLGSGGGSGSGASAGAIRAGRAFVEFLGNEGPLAKAALRAKAIVQNFGSFVGRIGSVTRTAGLALFAPITALFVGASRYAGELDDLADSFGSTVEKLAPGAAAFKVAGLGLEDFSTALKEVSKDGGTGPIEDQLDILMTKLNEIEDPSERARFALEKFGRAGVKMAAMAPDWERLKAQAPKVSSEDAKKAEQMQQAFAAALLSLQVALLPILDIITPIIQGISDFVKENSSAATVVAGVAVGLLAFSAAMSVVSVALGGVSMVLGGVVGLLGIVKAAFLALLSPVGLVVGAIAGIGVVFAAQTDAGKETMSRLKAGFVETANTAKDAWGGIVAAMKKGDMELAMRIVGAALRYEWAKIDAYWTEQWADFKKFFKDGWDTLGAALSTIWNEITYGMEKALALALEGIVKGFNAAITALANGAAWLLDKVGLDDTANKLRNFEGIGTNWINKWNADIDANRNQEMQRIGDQLARDLAQNEKDWHDQVDPLNREIADRLAEFKALVDQANVEKAGPIGADTKPYQPGGKPDFKMADFTKGVFQSPNFAAALGVADKVNDKALKAQEAAARNTKMIIDVLKAMPFAHFV